MKKSSKVWRWRKKKPGGAPYSTLSELEKYMSENIPNYVILEPLMKAINGTLPPSFKQDPLTRQKRQDKTIHQPLKKSCRNMKDQLQDLQHAMEFQICNYL